MKVYAWVLVVRRSMNVRERATWYLPSVVGEREGGREGREGGGEEQGESASTFAVASGQFYSLRRRTTLCWELEHFQDLLACKNSSLCPATEPDKASFHFHWPRFEIVFDFSVQ